jgi:hypothetical protein
VRLTLLLASSALAASLALGGCSTSGGSQALPGGSSVTPMGQHQLHLVAAGGQHPSASCPSSLYFTCITIYKGKNQIEICISSSGNCTSGLVGNWTWSGKIIHVKTGKKDKKFKVSFSPNPGNPTVNTIKVNTIKDSHGKIKYAEDITACGYPSGSCLQGAIGLIGG